MNKELEKELKRKIMAGEELTAEEKSYFVNYDEWKAAHDSSRAGLIESYRWNVWPFLFICAFFLLTTAFNNTKIWRAGGAMDTGTMAATIASWILGIAGVIGSFLMKGRANKLAQERREANQLILAPEKAEQPAAHKAETLAEKAALADSFSADSADFSDEMSGTSDDDTTENSQNAIEKNVGIEESENTDNAPADDENPDADEEAENLEAMIKICRLFHKN
ncbi:MAG: hypothetical protein Q4B22_10620 [Eubacteriales bacterium]|nr:hypothetical protein [Eubacteriales bacterium]